MQKLVKRISTLANLLLKWDRELRCHFERRALIENTGLFGPSAEPVPGPLAWLCAKEYEVRIRNLEETDYKYVIERLNSWWGGRNMADMLPRLFFIHFQDSSFICLDGDKILGFVVGFVSNVHKDTGYVHFVGVDPDCRRSNIAKSLYSQFFSYCNGKGVKHVKCVTSPVNKGSIAFHKSMGFQASSYDFKGDPVPIQNYDGPGEHRVVFKLQLGTQHDTSADSQGFGICNI